MLARAALIARRIPRTLGGDGARDPIRFPSTLRRGSGRVLPLARIVRSWVLLHHGTQRSQSVVHTRPERRLRCPENGGHVVVAELLIEAQKHRFPLRFGNLRKGAKKLALSLAKEQKVELVQVVGRNRPEVRAGSGCIGPSAEPCAPTKLVSTEVSRDREEKDFESGPPLASGAVGPDPEPRLLGDFL